MNPYYPNLLSPLQVGNTILKNRMICPPSEPHLAQAGENWPSDSLIAHYAQRRRCHCYLRRQLLRHPARGQWLGRVQP